MKIPALIGGSVAFGEDDERPVGKVGTVSMVRMEHH